MNNINIGVLVPNSSIFPIGKSFEKGLKAGLAPCAGLGLEVELINEFAAQSGAKQIGDTMDRLLNYHEADIVTGIISNHTASDVSEKFYKKQIPLLINNLGAHMPNINKLNPYVFINTSHLWRHAWSLGHYGVKNIGKKGMYVSAVYDAGYSFSQMFSMGMQDADAESEWSFAIAPMPPAGGLSDMSTIFPHIEATMPDFIFATFCGTENTLFLNEFVNRGLHKHIKLLGLPYLTTPFAPLSGDVQITSTLPYTQHPNITADKIFYEFGLQTGQLITQIAPTANNSAHLQQQLQNLGQLFNLTADDILLGNDDASHVILTENSITGNGQNLNIAQTENYETYGIGYDDLKPLVSDMNFGWLNPYLCI